MSRLEEYLEATKNESKLMDLGRKIKSELSKRKITGVNVEEFHSGYDGISITIMNKGIKFFVIDQPGKVGLEDQSGSYIELKAAGINTVTGENTGKGAKIKDMHFKYSGKSFGDTEMGEDMRQDAYEKIINFFKTWKPVRDNVLDTKEMKLIGDYGDGMSVYELVDPQGSKLNYADAKAICKKNGGRLPDIDELDSIFENMRGKTNKRGYWSADKKGDLIQLIEFSHGRMFERDAEEKFNVIMMK